MLKRGCSESLMIGRRLTKALQDAARAGLKSRGRRRAILPATGVRRHGASGGVEERIEPAGAIEGIEFVAAADVGIADEDLRHGAPSGPFHHLAAPDRLEIDADLVDSRDALALEQLLGADAIGADRRAIHEYARRIALRRHHLVVTGKPAWVQAPMPPARLNTFSKPARRSFPQADAERLPLAQQTMTGRALSLSISPMRLSSCDKAMCRAFGMWPPDHSPDSRTSMTIASSRLSSSVASVGETPAPPPPVRTGHNNMAPLTTASASHMIFA